MAAPYEVNILVSNDEKKNIEMVLMCHKLGYRSVVLNYVWQDTTLEQPGGPGSKKKKKNKSQPSTILKPGSLKRFCNMSTEIQQLKDLRIYTRFTLMLEESGQVRLLFRNEIIRSYDILAVMVTTEKMYDLACKTCDVDIITFNLEERMPFYFTRSAIKVAVSRGIHFEINYAPMLLSRECKRHTISNAQILVEYTKGKNIVMSGGCKQTLDTRGPQDVAFLGTMFGLSVDESEACIKANSRRMILHAESRKTMLGVVKMEHKAAVRPEDRWRLKRGQAYDDHTAHNDYQDYSDHHSDHPIFSSSDSTESDSSEEEPQPKKSKKKHRSKRS